VSLTYERTRRAITEYFKEQWGDITPVIWPNEEKDIGNAQKFIRFNIMPSSGRQYAVGGRNFRREGLVLVQIFVLQGSGQYTLGALEEEATRIFEDAGLPGIKIFDAGADYVGLDGRGYFQSNVRASFNFDK
jgi:uncharacterized protein YkuJ